MLNSETIDGRSKPLLGLLALYGLASLVHFVHNAEYTLYRRGRAGIGFWLLILYTSLGFDGLLHYRRAPVAAHTVAMNLAIWLEVVTAALALMAVVAVAARDRTRQDA